MSLLFSPPVLLVPKLFTSTPEHADDEDQKLKFDKQLRRLSQTQRANEEEVAGMPAPSTELSEECFRTIGIVVR